MQTLTLNQQPSNLVDDKTLDILNKYKLKVTLSHIVILLSCIILWKCLILVGYQFGTMEPQLFWDTTFELFGSQDTMVGNTGHADRGKSMSMRKFPVSGDEKKLVISHTVHEFNRQD